MEVNKELILKVAKNARLELSEEEIKQFLIDFKEILNTFSKLNEVNASNVKPSFQPSETRNSTREDNQKKCADTEELLKNSKHKRDNYFLGPKAL